MFIADKLKDEKAEKIKKLELELKRLEYMINKQE
jgi:hypothetical protein